MFRSLGAGAGDPRPLNFSDSFTTMENYLQLFIACIPLVYLAWAGLDKLLAWLAPGPLQANPYHTRLVATFRDRITLARHDAEMKAHNDPVFRAFLERYPRDGWRICLPKRIGRDLDRYAARLHNRKATR